jgi:hypothetical protein
MKKKTERQEQEPSRVQPTETVKSLTSCDHDYKYQNDTDFDAETYVCSKCGDRYKLYYEDMQ